LNVSQRWQLIAVGVYDMVADAWAEAGRTADPANLVVEWDKRFTLPKDPHQKRPWVEDLERQLAEAAPRRPRRKTRPPTPRRLSADYLRDHRQRLDSLGRWRGEFLPTEGRDGEGKLYLHWDRAETFEQGLFLVGLAFDLMLVNGSFDPDERMFELLELYRPHHADMLRWLEENEALNCTVLVARNVNDSDVMHRLSVWFSLERDEEHGYGRYFDPDTGSFGAMVC
jgi:hypothetical protein